jgi:hypothetical protein
MAYAIQSQLAEFLGVELTDLASDADRLLDRASELIDDLTMDRIDTTDDDHMTAAANACCAQVEWWLSQGESRDIEGPIQSYQAGRIQMTMGAGDNRITPTYLAPRAERFLRRAGLLYRGGELA